MKIRLFTIAVVAAVASLVVVAARGANDTPRPSRLERKADRTFIGGHYDSAMELNVRAVEQLAPGSRERFGLELKMARLYTLMQCYDDALEYYDRVREGADEMLTVEDVCLYIDNLRLVGNALGAEQVARIYAFRSPYNRNQRYLNTLSALENKSHYYGKGEAAFKVRPCDENTPKPEYWIGGVGEHTFYAVSHSTLQDPLKVYYHRNEYLPLGGVVGDDFPMSRVPIELHSGPVAFSPDGQMMVVTGIDGSFRDRIVSIDRIRGLYPTQLFFSMMEEKKGRWSAFRPLFKYDRGYSYAHPTLFNGARGIVFSSDFPGGYGGMDLYVCTWDEGAQAWSKPVNLGPDINTEGDEIYPFVKEDRLWFSSNGLEGFGGYDIYHVPFNGNDPASVGTIFHYPYPLNTTGNDFGLYVDAGGSGYFISDRRGAEGKDDIYTFNAQPNSLGSELGIGVSQQLTAMRGELNLVTGLQRNVPSRGEVDLSSWLDTPEAGELVASVYFDFDRWNITKESAAVLDGVLSDRKVGRVGELAVVGYADELGGEGYNQQLSQRRADEVAAYLHRGGIRPLLVTEGRGRIAVPLEYPETPQSADFAVESRSFVPLSDRIKMMRKARRVDIYVKKQQ